MNSDNQLEKMIRMLTEEQQNKFPNHTYYTYLKAKSILNNPLFRKDTIQFKTLPKDHLKIDSDNLFGKIISIRQRKNNNEPNSPVIKHRITS